MFENYLHCFTMISNDSSTKWVGGKYFHYSKKLYVILKKKRELVS
jgi:hypothetical protein